jgi:zona occludens toxin
MSIYAYVGLPGSGKSYNVVSNVILPALRDGRRVVTNVPLFRDKVLSTDGVTGELVDFPVDQVKQDPELVTKYVKAGDVFVLDEVWKMWPSGEKTKDIPDIYKTLLAEHRHMVDAQGRSMHICLVVQDLSSVAVFARKLVEQTFIHKKLGDMGLEGRFRVDIYAGSVTGVMGSDKMFIRSTFGQYVKEVWQLYQSHTQAQGSGGAKGERAVDRRGNFLRRPFFFVMIPLAVIAAVCVWMRVKSEEERLMHPERMNAPGSNGVPNASHPGFVTSTREPDRGSMLGSLSRPLTPTAVYRVLGYIEVPGSPERSKAILVGPSGQKITRAMSHCRFIDGDYFECNIDGEWYGAAGRSLAANDANPVPVSLPGGVHFQLPDQMPPQPQAAVGGGGAGLAVGSTAIPHPVSPPGS